MTNEPSFAGMAAGRSNWKVVVLAVVLLLAAAAPLPPLAHNRFHHDEAVYSSWGLDIASGRDVMVSGSPVDKPPLPLYLQAVSLLLFGASEAAARIPSLLSHVVSVWLLYRLGTALYDEMTGLLASLLLAASPYAILFAATAFTDSMMVAWVLAACLAAVSRRWFLAGLLTGAAAITKQQGVFFTPLVLGLGYVRGLALEPQRSIALTRGQVVRYGVGLLLPLAAAGIWDLSRGRQPGYLMQSLLSYGGLAVATATVGERLTGFVSLLRYGTGSRALNWLLLVGGGMLLLGDVVVMVCSGLGLRGWICRRLDREAKTSEVHTRIGPHSTPLPDFQSLLYDLVLFFFIAVFLLVHSLMSFKVWDRYMLGLIPLLVLLLARVLRVGWHFVRLALQHFTKGTPWTERGAAVAAALLLLGLLVGPTRAAAESRLSVGGDHGAYEGIEQVVAYMQRVPADTTLYHRWLGGHWRFYLWSNPYDFRYWEDAEDLARQAALRRDAVRYIVFPSWQSATEASLALEREGMALNEVHRALRSDGSVSFRIFRIEEAE
jgi:4-amino-4-deoxy-L-arabinose transferase-like glycosyltransferase